MIDVLIIKRNSKGEEVWRWSGKILKRTPTMVVIDTAFNRADLMFNGMLLAEGDRFIEVYYSDRWYNIFEIRDRRDDTLKGWYCNVTHPAEFTDGVISYIDLALDLLVFPDGRMLVLDEDEFQGLELTDEIRQLASSAIQELEDFFTSRRESILDWIDATHT